MSFALPESLRQYIDERVQSGGYGNTSEYLRDLIRKDQQAQAAERLRDLITAGLEFGPFRSRHCDPADDRAHAAGRFAAYRRTR